MNSSSPQIEVTTATPDDAAAIRTGDKQIPEIEMVLNFNRQGTQSVDFI